MLLRLALILTVFLSALSLLEQPGAGARDDTRPNIAEQKAVGVRATTFAISGEVRKMVNDPSRDGSFSAKTHELFSGERGSTDVRIHLQDAPVNPALFSGVAMPNPILSFDGLSNFDNVSVYNLLILPPDMVGEAGPDHYVQVVNSLFRVYDKNGGPLTPPLRISTLFSNLGTPCSVRNDGLPNILYDQLADRWVISQVCSNFPPFRQMIAVSKTGDPTGQWFAYEFVMPNVKLNDFPKISVWPDGYYMTTDEFLGSDYVGSGIFAFDREKMLAGDPSAGYVYMTRQALSPVRRGGFLPADLDGLRPPPNGTPAIFANYTATEYGDPQDAIRLFDFHADFANPANSTFTERSESPLTVAAFDPTSPNGRADISQPPPGEKLDSVSDTLMHRLAYRNHGSHQSLVVNQTIRMTPANETYRAGVRVYELRNTGSGFAPHVQATLGDTSSSRWIGSAAQDHAGNLAVQYNYVSDDKKVSVLYSGRLADDPPNTFRTEATLINGTGVQKAFGWRWGEYGGMSVDPVDDCTFWITNAYYTKESQAHSDFTWLTRIGTFKFTECIPGPRAIITGNVTNASNGQPVTGAKITAGIYSRNTIANGSYGNMAVVPGEYTLTAAAHGFRPQSFTVNPTNGQTLTQNFSLQPVAVLENPGTSLSAESCGTNGNPEPSETVTINISIRNTGAANTQNLVATLLATGGVTHPGPPQNYGSLPFGGAAVSRPFTFTVSSSVICGSQISLTLQLQDGSENLGLVAINLQTGTPKIAFQQNFDRNPMAQLPIRWTRSAVNRDGLSDNARNWIISRSRSQSPSKSVFSPDPLQPGVNEMVTPAFLVSTPDARLTFRNWYDLETTFLRNRLFDGSVLEIKIGTGHWKDILAAGGLFESGGYDGAIDGCCQNPLAGRLGWSGWSGINRPAEFITSSVKLPTSAAGQKVQLRWRVATDIGNSRATEGQYIDNILVTDGSVCGCMN